MVGTCSYKPVWNGKPGRLRYCRASNISTLKAGWYFTSTWHLQGVFLRVIWIRDGGALSSCCAVSLVSDGELLSNHTLECFFFSGFKHSKTCLLLQDSLKCYSTHQWISLLSVCPTIPLISFFECSLSMFYTPNYLFMICWWSVSSDRACRAHSQQMQFSCVLWRAQFIYHCSVGDYS